jgi:hypothetical protein
MAPRVPRSYRTLADLERAVCALCRHFDTSAVVIIGSQAILATWPDAPLLLRTSGEIDAYPVNARQWESATKHKASEEINALFGYLSHFHQAFGFYIDGVDETTASLPKGWRDRQEVLPISCDGEIVYALTPEIHDLAVSKLCRLEPKDEEFVRVLHDGKVLDREVLRIRLASVNADDEVKERALAFVAALDRL